MSAATIDRIQRAVVRCTRCPELRAYCAGVAEQKKRAYAAWRYWGKPVPAFGDAEARVMLVGLAPGAHGSNRTGRMFTGDASGDFLYPALYRAGFASQPSATDARDGMTLRDCFITAAARCAPPGNKPTPDQLHRCLPYLVEEIAAMPQLRAIVGLGAIGTKAAIEALRAAGFTVQTRGRKFGHAAEFEATSGERRVTIVASFHPSRQNTNTGKLTPPMFDAIFSRVNAIIANG